MGVSDAGYLHSDVVIASGGIGCISDNLAISPVYIFIMFYTSNRGLTGYILQ